MTMKWVKQAVTHPSPISTDEDIGELWTLADECREWAREETDLGTKRINRVDPYAVAAEFQRLSDRLDDIAKRLAARLPT
jgi:hypothetical protein